MNPGDIFMSVEDSGRYNSYSDGTPKVFLCKDPYENVPDAYNVERVGRNLAGEIIYLAPGIPKIVRDVILVKNPEVLE